MIILDTSAIVEFLNGTDKSAEILRIIEDDVAGVSTLSVNEVLIGAHGEQRRIARDFFSSLEIVPFDEEAAYRSVDVEEMLSRKGKPIGKIDTLIAATALVHNVSLLTADKDFLNVDGLKVVLV